MKKSKISAALILIPALLLSISIFSFCAESKTETNKVTGHFAKSGNPEALILKTPKLNSSETGCDGGCLTEIRFSDSTVPVIRVKDCIGGELTNLGDLNSDGLDEIGLLPGWFAGCWHNYQVYTFKHKYWHLAVPPFPTHCNEFETPGVKPITKNPAKPGDVLVTYSVFKGDSIVFATKSEPVNE